jgi:hypothetical protein
MSPEIDYSLDYSICEACAEDEHFNCDGMSWDENLDDWRPCLCPHLIYEDLEGDTP